MSDLIERLRALKTLDVHWERLATEAADEIERLQMELMACGDARGIEGMEYEKEIERLRAALERIRKYASAYTANRDMTYLASLARKALL